MGSSCLTDLLVPHLRSQPALMSPSICLGFVTTTFLHLDLQYLQLMHTIVKLCSLSGWYGPQLDNGGSGTEAIGRSFASLIFQYHLLRLMGTYITAGSCKLKLLHCKPCSLRCLQLWQISGELSLT